MVTEAAQKAVGLGKVEKNQMKLTKIQNICLINKFHSTKKTQGILKLVSFFNKIEEV
jgi:hypothetical protein